MFSYFSFNSSRTWLYKPSIEWILRKYDFLKEDLYEKQFKQIHWVRIVNGESSIENIHLKVHLPQFLDVRHFVKSIVNKTTIKHGSRRRMFHHHIGFHHISNETFYQRNSWFRQVPFRHYIKLQLIMLNDANMSSKHILFRCTKFVINTHNQIEFVWWMKCTCSIVNQAINWNR